MRLIKAIVRWYELRAERQMWREIRRMTPSNERLLRLARQCPPPQSWYDDEDDPTKPEQPNVTTTGGPTFMFRDGAWREVQDD